MVLKNSSIKSKTPIEKFYSGKSILITGSTGFLGKVLVEKLLRAFPDIEKLILILRDKRGKNGYERMEQYFDSTLFANIDIENAGYKQKVHVVSGDMTVKNLGLKEEDVEMIINTVNIVFHLAATVNFEVPLKKACAVNVHGSFEIANLSKKIKDLKCLIYVSTAFNHYELTRKEIIYPHPITPKSLMDIVQILDDHNLKTIEPYLMGKWFNVYTYTKNAAENVFVDTNYPTGIFRPSIVSSTLSEPVPSWADSLNGATGMAIGVSLGFKKVIKGNPMAKAHIVPADMVVNALIAVAWDIAEQRNNTINVYNYTPEENLVLWKDYIRFVFRHVEEAPFNKAIWYKTLTLTNCLWMYYLMYITLELFPAAIFDLLGLIIGQKPWLTQMCQKIHKSYMLRSNFGTPVWHFEVNNINRLWDSLSEQDKTLLNFNIRCINWEKYLPESTTGIKKFYFKEDMSPKGLSKAKKRYRKLYWLHQMVKFGFYFIIFAVLFKLFY